MGRPRCTALLALPFALLALAGCGDDDETTAADAPQQGCEPAEQPPPKPVNLEPPGPVIPRGQDAIARVETSCGTFVIDLETKRAPKTANSFAFLAEEGVYDDTWFHRIVTDAFIQGGDPLGDGTGGPGYSIREEPSPNTSYVAGTAAMAKTQAEPPGTSGSQFFIVAQADAGLRPDFAVFGRVADGMDVVRRIAALGDPASGQDGTPTAPVTIERVTIETG